MHHHTLTRWQHAHDFSDRRESTAERRVLLVVVLTALAMVAELMAGYAYGSMALVADGWHMASHAAALAISALAYVAARKWAGNPRFTLGTGKIGPLAGYSSALLLAVVAVLMAIESVQRLFAPVPVRYEEALVVAVLGLAVNLLSAWILRDRHGHGHGHGDAPEDRHGHGRAGIAGDPHPPPDHHHGHDHNLTGAYLHVLADAATSLLAIGALLAGRHLGWDFLDAAIGLGGAALILHWAAGLGRRSAAVLLDAEQASDLVEQVRERIETGTDDRVADLHVWRVGLASHACMATVVTHEALTPDAIKERLAGLASLRHVTVEIHRCG